MKKSLILFMTILILLTGCNEKKNDKKEDNNLTSSKITTTEKMTSIEGVDENKTTEKVNDEGTTTTSTSTKPVITDKSSKATTKVSMPTKSTTTKKKTTTTKKPTTTKKNTTTKKRTTAKKLTEKDVYNAMIALKKKYPTGTPWDDTKYYGWKGGIYSGGTGCAGFAFMLSDAAFGNRKARKVNSLDNLKVGDIIRYLNDSHFVIVLNISGNTLTLAEGNMNSAVYWGRKATISEIKNDGFNYVLTRW